MKVARGLIRIGFGLEAIGRWCLRTPRMSLVILLFISIAATISATRIGFDDNLYEIYRDQGEEFARYTRMTRLFPIIQDRVVVVLEGPGVVTREGLELLRDIHLKPLPPTLGGAHRAHTIHSELGHMQLISI